MKDFLPMPPGEGPPLPRGLGLKWPQVSSCIEDESKRYCETCQADDELCQEWIEHLKEKGYEATEIELGELTLEESLPKFLEQKEIPLEAQPVVQESPVHGEE